MPDDQTDVFGDKVREFLGLATDKGFPKDEVIMPACIMAGSKQMHEHYGDSIKAMEKVIELCKQYDDQEEFLEAVLRLTGVE